MFTINKSDIMLGLGISTAAVLIFYAFQQQEPTTPKITPKALQPLITTIHDLSQAILLRQDISLLLKRFHAKSYPVSELLKLLYLATKDTRTTHNAFEELLNISEFSHLAFINKHGLASSANASKKAITINILERNDRKKTTLRASYF